MGQAATDTAPSSPLGAGPEGEAQQSRLSLACAWDGAPSERAESGPLPRAQPHAETRPTQVQEPTSAALDGAVPTLPLGASLCQEGLGERTPAPAPPTSARAAEEGADGTPSPW